MDLYSVRKKLSMGIPLTNINLRVTDYSRVSTDHIEQKKSLQNQVEHFDEYIKENENWTYITGYVDDGITGTSDIKRDSFMKMIDDAKNDKFDLIITKEISRFSRNTLDSIKYTRKLLSYGVAVYFVNDNINTAMPDAELRLTIMASMAQDEIRRLSERVKFGMHRAIEKGEILGNDMLYGYKKNKDKNVLEIIDEEAKIVKRIYKLYAVEKQSLSKIAKILNSENIKTKWGNSWCITTISRIIENPKYKGYYCARKSEVIDYMTKKIKHFEKDDWVIYEAKNKIPPIIDENLWNRANKRLMKRKKSFSKRKKDKTIYQNRYIYSAKIFCKEDNSVFHRREFRRGKKDITWICSNYLKNRKENCDSPNIRESELNFIFEDLITKLSISKQKIISYLINLYSKVELNNDIDEKIILKKKEINRLEQKKDKLLDLSIDKSLSNSEFYERNNILNDKLQVLNNELKKLLEEQKTLNKNDNLKELKKALKEKVNSNIIKDKIINLILEKIIVSKTNNDKNSLKLEVYLSYKANIKIKTTVFKKHYRFKRGYDTKSTKRYIINYEVEYYLS